MVRPARPALRIARSSYTMWAVLGHNRTHPFHAIQPLTSCANRRKSAVESKSPIFTLVIEFDLGWVTRTTSNFFLAPMSKEVMTGQPPTGPVVYSLCNGNAHYIGATVDLDRRIEQHNASRVGGAHRTAKRGPGWMCTWYVDGFSSFQQSLQFEYALKRETKAFGYSPAARLRAVHVLVNRWGTQNDSLILVWHPYVP